MSTDLIHIHGHGWIYFRRYRDCGSCKARRRMVQAVPDNPWYSPTWHCLTCGDSWTDGARHRRPFARGWQQRARAKARAMWDAAPDRATAERQWTEALKPYIERDLSNA